MTGSFGIKITDAATMLACCEGFRTYTPANDIIMDELINQYIFLFMVFNGKNGKHTFVSPYKKAPFVDDKEIY